MIGRWCYPPIPNNEFLMDVMRGEPCQDTLPPGLRDVPKEPIVILKAYKK